MIKRVAGMGLLVLTAALIMDRHAQAAGGFIWPNTGWLSATNVYPNGRNHPGGSADIAAGYWTPIGASRAGRAYPYRDNYGANIVVIHHENGYATGYAHMVRWPSVYRGQWVGVNRTIGYVGSSGYATGPHTHFEISRYGVRVIIPHIWIRERVTRGYRIPGWYSGL